MTLQKHDFKYMRVLDDRVFYLGLLGQRMKLRRIGAIAIYLSTLGKLHLQRDGGQRISDEIVVVPPYQPHQLTSDSPRIISLLIEPERLAPGEMARVLEECSDGTTSRRHLARIRAVANRLVEADLGQPLTTAEFDRFLMGRVLKMHSLDRRVEKALDSLDLEGLEGRAIAASIAESVGLSSSRFLHLFKEQTGIAFRNFRMWRRARIFLHYANHSCSLTDVAMSLGYPDSSHFSHSIRKTYGLQPRSIRYGSQDLRIDSDMRGATGICA